MFGKDKYKRFVEIGKFGNITESYKVIVDLETGVNYLNLFAGYGVALTPLLDSCGNVVISSATELREIKNREL